MKVEQTDLPGVILCRLPVYRDLRGYFVERYHVRDYQAAGITEEFVQVNHSFSRRGVLRGMHYQISRPQAKLVTVLTGKVYDVVVDIRRNSPTFGKWQAFELDAEDGRQIFVPAGYAHGFCVLSAEAHFLYHCSDYYNPADDAGFHWASPGLDLNWPVSDPVLSEKDSVLPPLDEIPPERLPEYVRNS